MPGKVPVPEQEMLRHSFYRAGSVVFEQGEKKDDIYILKKGAVTVSVDGRMLGLLNTPNTVIGEMASILGIPRTATIQAVEDSEFAVVPASSLYHSVMKNPDLGLELIRILSTRLANTSKYAARLEKEITETRNELRRMKGLGEEKKPNLEEEMVRYGIISEQDLESCREDLERQKSGGAGRSLVNILIERNLLSLDQLIEFLQMKQVT